MTANGVLSQPPQEHSVPERLLRQADMCTSMGSRLYGELLRAAVADFAARGPTFTLYDDPERAALSRIGIRLMGALHYLALDGSEPDLARHLPSTGGDGNAYAAWGAARDIMQRRLVGIEHLVNRTPQTNEVARSMPLMAGFLAIADRTRMPLRIFEIGASAGLNLRWDSYRYVGDGWSWGRADSPLVLRNRAEPGFPKHLGARVEICERRGCDLNPLDASDPAAGRELLSFTWADQTERFDRLRAALEIARAVPVTIDRADGVAWIRERVVPMDGATTVVVHSVVTEHLSHDVRAALRAQIEACGSSAASDAPFAWLRMEPDEGAYTTRITLWPGNEDCAIAASDGHAQGLRWL